MCQNQMAYSEEKAAQFFHLRLMMVSVEFDTKMTFGDLCKDGRVQQLWREYQNDIPPPSTAPVDRWDKEIVQVS